jgi:hypothetical protein
MRIRFIATPTSLMLPRGESWSEGDIADFSRDHAQRWIGLDVAVEAPAEPEPEPDMADVADILAEANPPPAAARGRGKT